MSNRAAIKADRNLIVAVDQLILGPGLPRKGTATALGYILHIANGEQYYEPASGLSDHEKRVELQFLTRARALERMDAEDLADFINIGSGIAKMSRYPRDRFETGLRLQRCTTIRNPR